MCNPNTLGDRKDIFITHLIIIIKPNQPSPLLPYFPWLRACDGCTNICCRFHIYPRETGFCVFLFLCSLMMCANNRVHYDPTVVVVCLHITLPHCHHYADLSEGIELLKFLSNSLSSVCQTLSQFSQPSFMQYMGLCVFSFSISLLMIVKIRVLYLIIIINRKYDSFGIF